MTARRWAIVVVAIGLAMGAASCILGPKQDDPSGADNNGDATTGTDSGVFKADSTTGGDTAPPPPHDTGTFGPDGAADVPAPPLDGVSDSPSSDGDAASEASIDADADGAVSSD